MLEVKSEVNQKLNGWGFDIEGNGLYLQSTSLWYIYLKSHDGERTLSLWPFREGKEKTRKALLDWIESFPDGAQVSGHNILGYDAWVLWKFFDIKPRVGKKGKDFLGDKQVQFVDTFVLSMYLNPNSPFHSLAYLAGEEEGKIDYRQSLINVGALAEDAPKGLEFSFYHDLLVPYCNRDVNAAEKVLRKLWAQAISMYKDTWLHPSFKQMQKDYFLYSAQAFTGVKFDVEKARALVAYIEAEMKILKDFVDPLLPPRPLKTAEMMFYKQPAKPFSKAGERSSFLEKFLVKHNATINEDGMICAYGLTVPIEANATLPVKLPMEIDDNTEMKDYFIQAGWKPSEDHWNHARGEDGKPLRDDKGKLIKTTPKLNHQGQLCPNLLKLQGEVPAKVVKFMSYRNRLGVVNGWLNNWRIEFDGRLSAEISGYAPTSRVKHRTVTNVPKADIKVLVGNEMRELFTVEKGFWYAGTDAAALENRTLASYTFKYDGGKFARLQTEGDPHSFNAFAFFPEIHKKFDINDQGNKENPEFKPYRNKAKTGAYLLAFGGGAPKLASSLGLSKEDGKKAFDNYWTSNEGLGKLKTAVEKYFESTGKGKHIVGIDGRIVSVRGKNVLLSCLGQGLGAICMSYAACFMDSWLGELCLDDLGRPYYLYKGKIVKRISMVHDEYSWECEDGIQEDIQKMSVKAIVQAGEFLKLSLPLNGEGKLSFEGTWKDVH